MNEAILYHVRSIDEKLNKKEYVKQFNFMVTYKCKYEPPTNTAVFTYKFERSIEPSLDYECGTGGYRNLVFVSKCKFKQ